ncbi:MAG TPA: hypothetical protein VHV56_03325 [Pseudolabrys sp.]|jgi:hypothetical protein|nr:hypothetical protein [Pseudolabrys sp.]
MGTNANIDRIKRALDGVLEDMHTELDRIEILLGALNGFNQPVPDYEQGFQNLYHYASPAQELGRPRHGEH